MIATISLSHDVVGFIVVAIIIAIGMGVIDYLQTRGRR